MKKVTLLLVIGVSLIFSASLVLGQGTAYTPDGFNAMLESYKLKLADPKNCPMDYVSVVEGKNVFGTTAIAYTPAQYNAILETYGLKLVDPKKTPLEYVTVTEGKYIFGTSPMAYADYIGVLEAYGVNIPK